VREVALEIAVSVATTSEDLDQVRLLMRAFVAWHKERHSDDLTLIDAYFDQTEFEAELASLPGKYTRPSGQLLLARFGEKAAGCVALKRIDTERCEMKRMFVYPEFHGKGIGTALAKAIIEHARTMKFHFMLLDTSIRQKEAQRLYANQGFLPIEPYYDLSENLRDWLVFMKLDL